MICALTLLSIAAPAQPRRKGVKRAERHEFLHEIDKLEDTWRDAVMQRNVQAMEGLLADDYIAILPNGNIQSKEQALENLRSGTLVFSRLEIADRKVRFYGKTALVTSRAEVSGNNGDGEISGAYRYTRVYARDNRGNWKIVSFEASKITPSRAGQ